MIRNACRSLQQTQESRIFSRLATRSLSSLSRHHEFGPIRNLASTSRREWQNGLLPHFRPGGGCTFLVDSSQCAMYSTSPILDVPAAMRRSSSRRPTPSRGRGTRTGQNKEISEEPSGRPRSSSKRPFPSRGRVARSGQSKEWVEEPSGRPPSSSRSIPSRGRGARTNQHEERRQMGRPDRRGGAQQGKPQTSHSSTRLSRDDSRSPMRLSRDESRRWSPITTGDEKRGKSSPSQRARTQRGEPDITQETDESDPRRRLSQHRKKDKKKPRRIPKTPALTKQLQVVVKCKPGLEHFVRSELRSIGIESRGVKNTQSPKGNDIRGLVSLDATLSQTVMCYERMGTAASLMIQLPTTSLTQLAEIETDKVLASKARRGKKEEASSSPQFYSFYATGMAELRRKVSSMHVWKEIFDKHDADTIASLVRVRVSSYKSRLFHTKGIEERILSGIQDALTGRTITEDDANINKKDKDGKSSSEPISDTKLDSSYGSAEEPTIVLEAKFDRDSVSFYLDASSKGTPLQRRGEWISPLIDIVFFFIFRHYCIMLFSHHHCFGTSFCVSSSTPTAYRLATAKAPLSEDIAHSLVNLCRDTSIARWRKATASHETDDAVAEDLTEQESVSVTSESHEHTLVIVDPFCGSGTIAIEAALANLSHNYDIDHTSILNSTAFNSYQRSVPLKGTSLGKECRNIWKQHKRERTDKLFDTSTTTMDAGQNSTSTTSTTVVHILASDRDAGAIEACKSNAERAGVLKAENEGDDGNPNNLQFDCHSVSDSLEKVIALVKDLKQGKGPNSGEADVSNANTWEVEHPSNNKPNSRAIHVWIVTNPPYGYRLRASPAQQKDGDNLIDPMLPLYQTLGKYYTRLLELNDGSDDDESQDGTNIKNNNSNNNNVGVNVTLAMVVQDIDLARQMGVPIDTAFHTNHGGLPIIGVLSRRHDDSW
jgi:23S rRNA G2445 N2-methylase RlmL